MQLPLGARGVTGLEITTYGPLEGLHSGHYGNWAPNPIVSLAHLITMMRDEEANILIPGFYDDVRPVTAAEKEAIAAAPNVDEALRRDFAIGRTEGEGAALLDQIMRPSLNVRGIQAGGVGPKASNVIVPTATDGATPVVIVPIANHDDNQHAANENIRLQNLWDGIEAYAALMMGM